MYLLKMPASAMDCVAASLRRLGMRRLFLLWCVAVLLVQLLIQYGVPRMRESKHKQRLKPPPEDLQVAAANGGDALLRALNETTQRCIVVAVSYGLGNRLRALASAMAVAAASGRPLVIIWVSDAHCGCSARHIFAGPLPFAIVEEQIPLDAFSSRAFQVFDYMPHGAGGRRKLPWIDLDQSRHVFVQTAFQLAHARGEWRYAKWQLRALQPAPEVASKLLADGSMVGVHVRGVVDMIGNYSANVTAELQVRRNRGRWPRFVPRMRLEPPSTRFYVAADSADAYEALERAFPGRIYSVPGRCRGVRCDLNRDCSGLSLALADMLNLGRTRLILSSGYSSFSEVATYLGAADWVGAQRLPVEEAGVHF